jgi:Protein of unknown function (DUF3108)
MAYTMAKAKPLQTKHWLALLGTLFVMVLIAHLAIIASASGQFSNQKSEQIKTFTTRMIELPTPTPVTEKIPEVVTQRQPAKPKTKVTAAPIEVPITKPAPATQATSALFPAPVESIAAAPTPPEQEPPTNELAAPTTEPTLTAPIATSGDSGLPPPAFTALQSGQYSYKVIVTKNGNPIQGKARITWQQDGEKYTMELSIFAPIELLNYKSNGLLMAQGLMPLDFYDKTVFKSTVAAHFIYAENKITFSTTPSETELISGAQDRSSILMQMAGLLAADPARYTPGTTFSIQIVNAREAEPWLFTVNQSETLNLENGSQIALRLTRNPRREFDRKIELWFVPAMNYLPVRYRLTESNGDYQDLMWVSSQILPNTLPR